MSVLARKKKTNKETKLGEKTIDNDVMKWSKPRATISTYKFFFSQTIRTFQSSKRTIRFWERARSITVWFSQTVVRKIDKTALYLMNYRQIFSHFGRIKSNFFSEGNSTDFHLIVISRSLFFFDLIFELFKSRTGFHFRFSNFYPLPTVIIITFKLSSLFFYPWPLKRSVREPEQMLSI